MNNCNIYTVYLHIILIKLCIAVTFMQLVKIQQSQLSYKKTTPNNNACSSFKCNSRLSYKSDNKINITSAPPRSHFALGHICQFSRLWYSIRCGCWQLVPNFTTELTQLVHSEGCACHPLVPNSRAELAAHLQRHMDDTNRAIHGLQRHLLTPRDHL